MTNIEALRVAIDQHLQVCPTVGSEDVECPCGSTRALCCGTCGLPVFMAYDPSLPVCPHAIELADASHADWWGGIDPAKIDMANEALALGEPVQRDGLVAVPDSISPPPGEVYPHTLTWRRNSDKRVVRFYSTA